MKIELNPFEVPTKSLRTLAHFFNCLAADAEGTPHPGVDMVVQKVGDVSLTTVRSTYGVAPAPLSGNEQADVPSASNPTIPPPPPVADAQQEQSSSNVGELDVNGLPWDARIHASTKGKNQDGSWKALRGVDKTIVPGIEAELRARVGSTAQTPPPPPPVPSDDQVPPPPPVPTETPEPPPVGQVTMQQAFQRATALQKEKLIDQDGLNACLQTVGLSTMAEFLKACKERPEVAGEFLDALNAFAGDE